MKILIEIIIALVCVIFGIFAFFENQKQKQELKKTKEELESLKKTSEVFAKGKRENEELVQKMHSGSNIDSANASVELMQKLSEKGKQRNSK